MIEVLLGLIVVTILVVACASHHTPLLNVKDAKTWAFSPEWKEDEDTHMVQEEIRELFKHYKKETEEDADITVFPWYGPFSKELGFTDSFRYEYRNSKLCLLVNLNYPTEDLIADFASAG